MKRGAASHVGYKEHLFTSNLLKIKADKASLSVPACRFKQWATKLHRERLTSKSSKAGETQGQRPAFMHTAHGGSSRLPVV
jgi:hypothetical protein